MTEEHLDISTILSPDDMNNPLVDDLSVVTSLSYFYSSAVRTDGTPKWSGVFFTNLQMFSLALRGYNSEISGTSPGLSVSRKAPKLRDSFQSEKLVISFSDRTSFIHLKSLSNAEEEKYEREVTTERSSTRGLFMSSGERIVEMSRCSSVIFISSPQFSVPFRRYREAWSGMRPV